MARTALTPTAFVRDGSVADPGGTTINTTLVGTGAYVADPPGPNNVKIRVVNSDTNPHNVIIRAGGSGNTVSGGTNPGVPFDSAPVGDLTVAVAASQTVTIGPLTSDRFCQADGSLSIDFSSGFTGTIWVFREPVTHIGG